MADSRLHVELWRRLRAALAERGVDSRGSPGETARAARAALGTAAVERFLDQYFNEREYAGGPGALSDAAAEALVREVEALPRAAKPAAPVDEVTRAPTRQATPIATPALEEAEAYGDETPSFSIGRSLRHFWLSVQSDRAARRAESERRRREEEARALERRRESEQAETERERLATEAALRARQSAEAQIAAEERDRAAAEERQREAKRQRQARAEAEERERALAQRREVEDLARRASSEGAQRPGQAVVLLERLVALEPENAQGWFALAWYYSRAANWSRSTECYRKGLVLEPANKVALNNLGRDLRRLGRLGSSVEALRKAVALDADYATGWANLGGTLRAQRDFAGAADAFARATALSPGDSAGWYWLGACQWQLRQHDKAAASLTRSLQLLPDNRDGWLRLAYSLKEIGRRDEARQAEARARALVPADTRLGLDAVASVVTMLVGSWLAPDIPALATITPVAFFYLLWRMRPSRPQLFVFLMIALPTLALPFSEAPESAVFATAALVLVMAIVGRVWRRFG